MNETGEAAQTEKPAKNPHAVALARLRADSLSPERRLEISRLANAAPRKARKPKA